MSSIPATPVAGVPPTEMQGAARWLHYALEPRAKADGTPYLAKVPYYITGARRQGNINADGAQLVDYRSAVAALAMWGDTRAGLGFALGEGWQGIDFDHIDTRPALAALVPALPGYVEWSPSGTGVHAIGYGLPFDSLGSNGSGIEAYARGRFFTFTGRVVRPGPIVDLGSHVAGLRTYYAANAKAGPVVERAPFVSAGTVTSDTLADLADALRYLDADDRQTWISVGYELKTLGDAGRRLWSEWSSTTQYPGGAELELWDGFRPSMTGYGGVFVRAKARGWKNPKKLDLTSFDWSPLGVQAAPSAQVLQFPAQPLMQPPTTVATGLPVTLPPVPDAMPVAAPAARIDGQQYRQADGTQRAASIENVIDALGSLKLGFDTFLGRAMLDDGGRWRPVEDNDYSVMRETLGRGGFKPVGREIMVSAVDVVAYRNQFDSVIQWANALRWDGVSRIDKAMSTYYGCDDSLYSRSVGAYIFTAMAGRALVPGIKADMAIILIGLQGVRKTSAIEALAPEPESFGEVNLNKSDEQIAYLLRGKLVIELAEMRGIFGRDIEATKAWVTRRHEEWREPYKRFLTRYARRCLIFGTGNEREVLNDPTGERRWLPLMAGTTDVAGIERDREQLWAEGVARFKQGGIEWALAESLAKAEHGKFKVHDEWTEPIERWLAGYPSATFGAPPPEPGATNGSAPFALLEVAEHALGFRKGDAKRADERRIGQVLRNLGYEKGNCWIGGTTVKRWRKL